MKLIRDIHKFDLKKSVVNSMVEFSKSTGIQLIAEGIETEKGKHMEGNSFLMI